MSLQETQEFFERYRGSFNSLDGDAVAELWHVPSAITDARAEGGHARLTTWTDEAAMRANWHALCELYRSNGYERADFELMEHVPMGARHAFARVHWTLRRKDGSVLQAFHTGYNLAKTERGPKVLLCTAYEEHANYQED